ncbi:MAG TPA: hypothetical protein VEX88_01080 [Glaciibacter sp.]|nr:hypothetical protein [Glaciibacter sp.]
MPLVLFTWSEQITVCTIALVMLGLLLHPGRETAQLGPVQARVRRLASVVAFAGVPAYWLSRRYSTFESPNVWQYAIPILIASIAVALYAVVGSPRLNPRPLLAVDLTPRTLWSFGPGWWFAGWAALTGLLVTTVVLAGLSSSTDDSGRHSVIAMQMGSGQASTLFFGWFFGLPVLAALILLTASALIALWRIARPAVPSDPSLRDHDRAVRRIQTRTVLSLASGAVAFTLGATWTFIARASAMAASISGPDGIQIHLGTSFAALGTPLTVLGLLLMGCGVALLLLPLLQRRRQPSSAVSAPEHAESVAATQ